MFLKCTGAHSDPTFLKNVPLAATPPRDPRQSRSNLCCRPVHLADPNRMQRLSQPHHVSEYSVRFGLRPFPHQSLLRTQDQNPLVKRLPGGVDCASAATSATIKKQPTAMHDIDRIIALFIISNALPLNSLSILSDVRFSNRPDGIKRFQAIHDSGVNVTRGLVLPHTEL